GHIWRTGYVNNELKGEVYEDVPEALKRWQGSGIKVYIYSSGSRLAQRLIFGNTNFGDLRKYLSGFFDTTIGTKLSDHIDLKETLRGAEALCISVGEDGKAYIPPATTPSS
ncbi:hypothetical protein Droror1_Dr00025382, partial [Drosera rotundifolia]